MRRPSLTTYAIGNSASMLGILGVSGLFTYQWFIGQEPNDWVPLTALVAVVSSVGANQRLTAYGNWKRAWDTMGDGGVRRSNVAGAVKILFGIAAWIFVAAYIAALDLRQPESGLFFLGFAVFNLLLLARAVFRKLRSGRAVRASVAKPVIVSIVPKVPRSSPGVADYYRGLPPYCAGHPLPR